VALAKPRLGDLGVASEHGRVHELAVELPDGQVELHTWSAQRPLLLWSPRQRALVFVHGLAVPRARAGAPRTDGAAQTYERFHGEEAETHRELELPAVELKDIGRAAHIAYKNRRWGGVEGRVAQHDFGRSVRAYLGTRGNLKVYVVAGGRLRMTARGIEG
jgi:hypothetical protein